MLDRYFHSRRVHRRIARNLLVKQLAALAEHLDRRGHTVTVIQSYVQAAEHFGYWLRRTGRTADDVDIAAVRTFLTQHLPRCRCPAPHSRTTATVRAALHQLLLLTQARSSEAPPSTPIDSVAMGFDSHLEMSSGLAAPTRLSYGRFIREFLAARYGTGPVDLTAT